MRINYIVEDFSVCGGVERIVSDKANILSSKYGHDVTIISVYKDDRPARYELNESVRIIRLDIPMARKSGNRLMMTFNRIATLLKAAARLNKKLKETNPDIIFFTTTLGALLLPLCRTKARKIFESHSARKYTPYNKFFYFVERSAECVVCLTESDARTFRHARNVRVISNFVKTPSQCVKDYNRKAAIAVGRLERVKGFDILIDIWKSVAMRFPDWQLHIYGEGPLRDELQQQIDRSGLRGIVTLCGRCDNMTERYTDYSLHLMTSRYEGQGIVLIEAQICGLASVVFDYEYGARYIIDNGVNGLIVDQGDKESFIKAVTTMMDDVDKRRTYGHNARLMSFKYSKEFVMPKWCDIIAGRW